jgi:hypothetical protein
VPELLDDTKARYKFLRWREVYPKKNYNEKELKNWLNDNCTGKYQFFITMEIYISLFFEHKADAAKFKLFWT